MRGKSGSVPEDSGSHPVDQFHRVRRKYVLSSGHGSATR